tara:strand:+ start:2200 stop:2595 length:396 start_codon:yes stop_codon:yes gene_type:complete
MLAALIPSLLKGVFGIVDQVVEDKDEANRIKAAITERQQDLESQEMEGRIKIILAEAQGSWLQSNWRPLLMLVAIIIIANNFLVVPYATAMGLTIPTLELPDALWNLLTVGVGGYVLGRSGEKIMNNYKRP